jgi:hypothetical protein
MWTPNGQGATGWSASHGLDCPSRPSSVRQTVDVKPSRGYLAKIGELAYQVSQLEWLIIDDIRLASTPIDAITLHGLPTGAIGRALETLARDLTGRPNVQHFVNTSAKALLNVAARRNTVLHARPGTTRSGDVTLLKLRVGDDDDVEGVWVDDAFLDRQLAAVRYWLRRVEQARELPLD